MEKSKKKLRRVQGWMKCNQKIYKSYLLSIIMNKKRIILPKEVIIENYEEDIKGKKLSKKLGISYSTLYRRMEEYGLKRKSRKYDLDEDFFLHQNKKTFWVLGWVASDGCVSDFFFNISQKDYSFIEKIRNIFNKKLKIFKDKRTDVSVVQVYSKKMVNDLNNWGMIKNKSKFLKFPDISIEFLPDFIRGYFEGDGGVYSHFDNKMKKNYLNVIICGTNDVVSKMLFLLKKEGVVFKGSICEQEGLFRLTFGQEDSINFYKYIYDNCGDLFYYKKKNKFENLLGELKLRH